MNTALEAQKAYDALHNKLVSKYLPLQVLYKDAAGRSIERCVTFMGIFIILFDDGKYTAVENDSFDGMSDRTLSLELLKRLGLMAAGDITALEDAVTAQSEAAWEANHARDLQNLIQHYGRDKLKEMLNG